MSLSNVARRLTAAERAREPLDMGVVAWFDGNGQGTGLGPMTFPRRLTVSEAEQWREGWRQGCAEARCHAAHGFAPCPGLDTPH